MVNVKITPPEKGINAQIVLPSSKSICNRALIINALAKGNTTLLGNLSDCDDTRVTVNALRNMPHTIDIMAAGTAMRFLTAFLAVNEGEEHIITGTERMRQRPIKILVDALRELGAKIDYVENEGYPPLRISGMALSGGELSLPGNVSSQYISALLMIGPVMKNGLKLTLTGDVVSRPYIDMTLIIMKEFGAEASWVTNTNNVEANPCTRPTCLEVKPKPYHPIHYYIESDWSAASYWYEIAALSKEARIELPGLKENTPQGDSAIAALFAKLGVKTEFTESKCYNPSSPEQCAVLTKGSHVAERLDYDFTSQPDMAQTFVVTCAMMNVPFKFKGLQSLKIKETDRIAALIAEMKKLGYVLKETDGSQLEWDGTRCAPLPQPAIDTYEDHRMAMAFAPAAIVLGELRINNPQVVSKSYPTFWNDLTSATFNSQLSTLN